MPISFCRCDTLILFQEFWGVLRREKPLLFSGFSLFFPNKLEEDKRATTNVQDGLVFFLFFSLFKKGLNFKKSPGGNCLKKCAKVPKSVKKYRNDFAL